MSTAEIIGAIIGTVCLLIWVPCAISWIRRGVSIPRYIHVVALATTSVGVGWFWLSGPELLQSASIHPNE